MSRRNCRFRLESRDGVNDGLKCDRVVAASVLDEARAELMAIISECMLRTVDWDLPVNTASKFLRPLFRLDTFSSSSFFFSLSRANDLVGKTPVLRAPPSKPGR